MEHLHKLFSYDNINELIQMIGRSNAANFAGVSNVNIKSFDEMVRGYHEFNHTIFKSESHDKGDNDVFVMGDDMWANFITFNISSIGGVRTIHDIATLCQEIDTGISETGLSDMDALRDRLGADAIDIEFNIEHLTGILADESIETFPGLFMELSSVIPTALYSNVMYMIMEFPPVKLHILNIIKSIV